jgi:hypothetical protein
VVYVWCMCAMSECVFVSVFVCMSGVCEWCVCSVCVSMCMCVCL